MIFQGAPITNLFLQNGALNNNALMTGLTSLNASAGGGGLNGTSHNQTNNNNNNNNTNNNNNVANIISSTTSSASSSAGSESSSISPSDHHLQLAVLSPAANNSFNSPSLTSLSTPNGVQVQSVTGLSRSPGPVDMKPPPSFITNSPPNSFGSAGAGGPIKRRDKSILPLAAG